MFAQISFILNIFVGVLFGIIVKLSDAGMAKSAMGLVFVVSLLISANCMITAFLESRKCIYERFYREMRENANTIK